MTDNTRTVLVSGASSGIGYAIAQSLLDAGHHVIGIARDFSKIKPTPLASNFYHYCIDLEQLDELPNAFKPIQKAHPDIDTIICCAGRGHFASLEEFSYQHIRSLMDLNFLSQAYLTKTFLPTLKQRKQADIIFIGSEAALTGTRKGSIYCASKFALRGFAQALREECSRSGLRISIINPGMVNTDFFEKLDFRHGDDEKHYIRAEDVANTVNMIINAHPGTNFDEINLSPLQKVIQFSTEK